MRYFWLVILSACVQAVPLGSSVVRPTVPADSVVVYRTAEQVPRKYTEVALLTPTDDPATNAHALQNLRKKAGSLGANGLLMVSTAAPTTGMASRVVAIYVEP